MRFEDGFVITNTAPFITQEAGDVIRVPDALDLPSGGGAVPLETPMHAAIYREREDVAAICRGHPPAVVAWGTGTVDLPLLHGLGALAGERVPVHADVDLITTPDQGKAVAATLGAGHAVVLRANGCLAVGASPLEAITRLYFLEERAAVARRAPADVAFEWGGRLRHTGAELRRAMAWMEAAFGGLGENGERHDDRATDSEGAG
jgi:ribulose-5-phosphate 4-epimerase/fuculose-1-phosphate aldolase